MKKILWLLLIMVQTVCLQAQKSLFRRAMYTPPTDDKVFVDFMGSGDLQKSVNSSSSNANSGLGVVFEKLADGFDTKFIESFELEGILNVASTQDTIKANFDTNGDVQNRRDFGNYILNPVSSKNTIYFNSNFYFGANRQFDKDWLTKVHKFCVTIISGVNVRFTASNSVWVYHPKENYNLGALGYRIGFFHDFIPDNYRFDDQGRAKYSVYLGFYYTHRGITGDVSTMANEGVRQAILGSNLTDFDGWEASFGIRLNSFRVEFQMPAFNYRKAPINGFTNTQFVFSIRFIGGFPLKLGGTGSGGSQNETPPKDPDKKDG